jgi:DNA polymerase bacteriophage-type
VKIDFIFDFETRSHVDLPTYGAVNYAVHPSTEMTRLTYCFGRTGSPKIWRPLIEPVPADTIEVALHPEKYNLIAWNIFFDYLIWICVLSRKIPGLKHPPLENIHDAMALSCHFRTGASLESASKFMNLPMGKDPEGRKAMLKSCKPGRDGQYIKLTQAEEKSLDRYALLDTVILRDIYYKLPPLPHPERYAWEWTFRRNLEGIRVDVDLLNELNAMVDAAMPIMEREFYAITGTLINSHVRVKEWFKQYWPEIEDMRADTVRDMKLTAASKPAFAQRALEIKDLAGSTSISKLKTARNVMYLGRVYDVLKYHFAQTKRWSGNGVQIQNQPRVDGGRPDKLPANLDVADLAAMVRELRPGLKDPIGFAKNLIRRLWIPQQGLHFYCGDWSKIEPTTLFWLTGLGAIPKNWYEQMAAEIYNKSPAEIDKESEERQVGKTAALSCGYGAGWKSFITKTYQDTGILLSEDMARQVIGAYRRKYPQVVQFWADLEAGFRLAIHGQTSALCGGKVYIMPLHLVYPGYQGVAIRLPSGSYLFYHQARETTITVTEEVVELRFGQQVKSTIRKNRRVLQYLSDLGKGRVEYKTVYGGLLCENVTSASSRDLILPAAYNLEQAGFNILGFVHDEVWAEAAAGREQEFTRLMCINPSWCPDMDISSDLKCGGRYLK